MSDFGELCPLFNTGVFHEITFPNIAMTNVSITANALDHPTVLTSSLADFTFGRTVVVTECFVRKNLANTLQAGLEIQHRTSREAAATTFGSIIISITTTGMAVGYTWVGMTIAAGKTFTSSEVLGITMQTSTTSGPGTYDFIIRYKEK